MANSGSTAGPARAVRVSVERVLELVRHLTERDREIVHCLYQQQVLTTDQMALLFFSSRRRAQDRLLFLYRQRVLDRFYPAAPFGAGKPQAHWLLDEAGALIVCAMLGLERKQLGWQRRDDWGSHPQLAHRLEANRFLTDLVAATLPDATLGVRVWYGPRRAAARLGERAQGRVRPDAGFILEGPMGPIECVLEWDRATETQERLAEKLQHYRVAERKLRYADKEPRSVLFVVPAAGRIETLRRAYTSHEADGPWDWPILGTTVAALRREGPLCRVWKRIDRDDEPLRSLTELPARGDLVAADPGHALGRRWRYDRHDFWERLSPLSRPPAQASSAVAQQVEAGSEAAQPGGESVPEPAPPGSDTGSPGSAADPAAEALLARLRREREATLEQARADVAAARARRRGVAGEPDLRPSAINGFMDEPEDEAEEEPWR